MSPLHSITCASLPAVHLERLAPVRAWKQVKAQNRDGILWLCWPAHTTGVAELLYPLPGVELYEKRGLHWFAFKRQLPSFEVPDLGMARPLAELLFPAPVVLPAVPKESRQPVQLTLAVDSTPRQASALVCKLSALHDWLETVPTPRFRELRAMRQREQVLVMGRNLPPVGEAERYWGQRLLVPLGYRYEPFFPEAILLNIFDLAARQLLILSHTGMELIDTSQAQPLTRAGVKLALTEAR